jgi:hypothetical protein
MKVSIVKESVVIISLDVDPKAVKFLSDTNPKALALRTPEGEETFRLSVTTGEPGFSKYGVSVNGKRDIVINEDRPVTEQDVILKYGATLLKIGNLESQIKAAYAEFQEHSDQIQFELL